MREHHRVRETVVLIAATLGVSLAAPLSTEGNLGVVRTLSARPLKNFKLNIQLGGSVGMSSEMVKGPVDYGSRTVEERPLWGDSATTEVLDKAALLGFTVATGLGLAPLWDISASIPFYYDNTGFGKYTQGGKNYGELGLGDPVVATKICIPPAGKVWFNALYVGATIPVGRGGFLPRYPSYEYRRDSVGEVAGNMFGWNSLTIRPVWLMTLDFAETPSKVPFAMHLNGGVQIPTDKSGRNLVVAGLALEYTPVPVFGMFVDFSVEQRYDDFDPENLFRDGIHLSPGIRLSTPGGVYIQLSADFNLCGTEPQDREVWRTPDNAYRYSTTAGPLFAVNATVGWGGFLNPQDKDRDGIMDDDDRCPMEPEDIDGFEDSDGCPEVDNDKDGVPDSLDKCPNAAEDTDQFEDEDGCPDLDNDKDGIPDDRDKCPNEREDFDGFEDSDGCPDPDNDKDGVADGQDRCPNDPEDFDQFEDEDGCPDLDNDKDGIPDLRDKCPNDPETFNEVDDDDGCPDVRKKESTMPKHQILRGVAFAQNSAVLLPQSYAILDRIVSELQEYPEIEIEIRGHTDSSGKYEENMRLSQMRAEAVQQYIVSRGIDPRRVRAIGFGSSSPIADNRSAAGRAENRRIEVVRLK